MTSFLHGVEVLQIDSGPRTIQTVASAVIGVVGTAPNADAAKFPVNTPVLIAGTRTEAAGLGTSGTLPDAIDGIFDQTGAVVVVVRVEEGADEAATTSNIIGGVDAKGAYTGVHVLLNAQSVTGQTPKILIVPGHSATQAVAAEMEGITDRLKACFLFDGPNTTDAKAITYRDKFGSKRFYICDPWVRVWDTETSAEVVRPNSPRVAGRMAKTDNERGFWWSPSNNTIGGIVGTARPIDFALGDPNCRANLLNASDVATIIQQDGFRLWGNRTCSADPKWAFLSVVRTADLINESIQRGHFWAIDRNITKTYIEDVVESVNNYIRSLVQQGALLGGKCWADPELNTPDQLEAGRVYFDVEFTPPTPAERITFRSHLVNDYFSEVV
ncbi:phage tail sheath subtilisin-like domain-containing protein [Endozoicomonas acroporae]|uniref:phage tail sheath subtilisin-like domain-containing protein n=1 Tax=Endozoicomonas acroporae TaxID=1701104 RepID=UPI003D7932AD